MSGRIGAQMGSVVNSDATGGNMYGDDEASRAWMSRGVQQNQQVIQNRANLLQEIANARRTLPGRLQAAGYPSTNKYATMAIYQGRQVAVYVVDLGRGNWAGVLSNADLVSLYGDHQRRLQITGAFDLDSADVMTLAAINGLLGVCTQTKRFSWDPD